MLVNHKKARSLGKQGQSRSCFSDDNPGGWTSLMLEHRVRVNPEACALTPSKNSTLDDIEQSFGCSRRVYAEPYLT